MTGSAQLPEPVEAGTPGAQVVQCPLASCGWFTEFPPPGPAETPYALAEVFGLGVFAATATMRRLARQEEILRDHLSTHPLHEWVRALTEAQHAIRQLRAAVAELERGAA